MPGNLEVYEYAGAYGFKPGQAQAFARMRMLELEAAAKHFEGHGNERHLQCGRSFTLVGHESALRNSSRCQPH